MIQYRRTINMKPIHILGISALIVLLISTSLILSAFHLPPEPTTGFNTLTLQGKIAFPQIDTGDSEVGNTTGIFIMGVVIVLIITVPLFLRKKKH